MTRRVVGRLMEALKCQSIAALARELGVSDKTAYARSMRDKVPNEYILAVAMRTGYPPEWLQHGAGVEPAPPWPDRPSSRERALLDDFRRLDEFSKRSLERITRALAQYDHEGQAASPPGG